MGVLNTVICAAVGHRASLTRKVVKGIHEAKCFNCGLDLVAYVNDNKLAVLTPEMRAVHDAIIKHDTAPLRNYNLISKNPAGEHIKTVIAARSEAESRNIHFSEYGGAEEIISVTDDGVLAPYIARRVMSGPPL